MEHFPFWDFFLRRMRNHWNAPGPGMFREMNKTLFCIWEARAFFFGSVSFWGALFYGSCRPCERFFSGAPHFFGRFWVSGIFLEHLELFWGRAGLYGGCFWLNRCEGTVFLLWEMFFFWKTSIQFFGGTGLRRKNWGPFLSWGIWVFLGMF